MNYLITVVSLFFPWILYSILISYVKFTAPAASIVCATIVAIVWYKKLIQKYILNWIILIVLILNSLLSSRSNFEFITNNLSLYTNLLLAIAAWISLIIKMPITQQYARMQVTPVKWNHPSFIKINNEITAVWGAIFTVCASINYFKESNILDKSTTQLLVFSIVIIGIVFTNKYPSYIRQKNLNIIK
jgi:hypothetical protein